MAERAYFEPGREERARDWEGRPACSAGRSSIKIMTDGTTLTCDQVPVDESFMHGSVRNMSIEEAWNSGGVRAVV